MKKLPLDSDQLDKIELSLEANFHSLKNLNARGWALQAFSDIRISELKRQIAHLQDTEKNKINDFNTMVASSISRFDKCIDLISPMVTSQHLKAIEIEATKIQHTWTAFSTCRFNIVIFDAASQIQRSWKSNNTWYMHKHIFQASVLSQKSWTVFTTLKCHQEELFTTVNT